MSDSVIKFIPTNPVFVPKIEAINEAEEWITSIISNYDDIKILITDEIRLLTKGKILNTFLPFMYK
ncbi:hypothetical protein E3U55_12250 [Filobacillus milosensis]|uniref:Uncharacterized protein n=1 Tax=Filobacillus milosensis TaxID=94137 RepID=A0A4Y8ILK8_9BACI|nr:hypothetical protein [Filobacillus milosensis]TFB15021.1 hypothetical protein E3U55_12250 [Filobacillus milosensis]